MRQLLAAIDFRDPVRAGRNLARLAQHVPGGVLKRIESLLASSPNPDVAFDFLDSFRERQPEAFQRAASAGPRLQYLVAVFSYSRFLSEELLQHPEWLDDPAGLARGFPAEKYPRAPSMFLTLPAAGTPRALRLARLR